MSLLEKYRAFIVDLDGVVYLLDEPIHRASETINFMRNEGAPFVFLTNNSVSTPGQYVEKLKKFGIEAREESIITSSQAVGKLLDDGYRAEGKRAFAIGEGGLLDELGRRGLQLVGPGDFGGVDFVFVGWDRDFNFEKLKTAVVAIRGGAEFIATNADATYPTPHGLWPGAGTLVAAVRTGAGQEPVVAGKPNPLMVELALERLGSSKEETLLVGDRIDTDIASGAAAGVDTMLVLTGVSGEIEAREARTPPTLVADSIATLLKP